MTTDSLDEPSIYRAVIDDVIANIKPEFDEYGVSEDVLAELQSKWEAKVIASRVADFEPAPQPQPPAPPAPLSIPPAPYAYASRALSSPHAEPTDNRYMLSNPYGLPPLAGPQIPPRPMPGGQPMQYAQMNGRRLVPLVRHHRRPTARYPPPANNSQPASTARIPQVDGPSSSSSESPSPPPSQNYAPRSSHPSLPQPAQASATSRADDSEAINSDLDDSDSDVEEEGIEGGAADQDIVFCTYDKVARVKNKWKCVLKDGMIHINGKDYLFAKCSGEFEW
ncbi:hypothetical protein NUW54_g11546 [Trametes sanguinea]|uniref:Uncharacterized protein n=1 Tax=Trametes sanguinea TaxID=158606 RepID=A0ACC1NCG1_9APHY|nr:hypothetical protein NUW54_g11546 [Trametes sanguinea]